MNRLPHFLGEARSDCVGAANRFLVSASASTDYLSDAYPHFPVRDDRKIFPAVVTLENWRMFGPLMMNKLDEAVRTKMHDEGLLPDLLEKMPYSVWSIEELEAGLQIMHSEGIADFMDGKLRDAEMRQWGWHGYMNNRYSKAGLVRRLLDAEYENMFSELFDMQYGIR